MYAFVESSHEPGVFWAGSDDGLIHVSRDGGQRWENITPPDLLEWSLISNIEASPHDPAMAYVAVTRYKLDDYQPYLYKTDDYGKTWRIISESFPNGEITRVIREDPVQSGLLYVGTETGLHVSLDDGANWHRLQDNLPVVPVYDLKIKDSDLVAGTHGRSFWILDDVTPLRELAAEAAQSSLHLFEPRSTYRRWLQWGAGMFRSETGKNYQMGLGAPATFYVEKSSDGERTRRFLDAGEGPPQGVIVYYLLEDTPTDPVELTFFDADGAEIKTFTTKPEDADDAEDDEANSDKEDRYIPAEPGMNRFVWDMCYPDSEAVTEPPSGKQEMSPDKPKNGPLASPGTYQAQLKVGEQTHTQTFEICKDPRVTASQADLDAQFELWSQVRDKLSETHEAINRLRRIQRQVNEWKKRADAKEDTNTEAICEAAEALQEKLKAIEGELIQTGADTIGDRLRLPTMLIGKLAGLVSVVSVADFAPPKQAYELFEDLSNQIDAQLNQLKSVIEEDVAAFNDLISEADVPAVVT